MSGRAAEMAKIMMEEIEGDGPITPDEDKFPKDSREDIATAALIVSEIVIADVTFEMGQLLGKRR